MRVFRDRPDLFPVPWVCLRRLGYPIAELQTDKKLSLFLIFSPKTASFLMLVFSDREQTHTHLLHTVSCYLEQTHTHLLRTVSCYLEDCNLGGSCCLYLWAARAAVTSEEVHGC